MTTRKCGTASLQLPVLGIGCWSFGGGDYWGVQDQHDVESIIAAALDFGCNYFDTAEVYNDGRSESSLGSALRGRRSRAVVGTKVKPNNTAPNELHRHCEDSLRRLQTDYIDLYMVHWPIRAQALKHYTNDETMIAHPPSTADAFETLSRLREEGKICHFGVSNFGVSQLEEIKGYPVVANQLCYNLLSRGIEFEIIPACHKTGIGVLGYMPLLQGILTGKYRSLDEIPAQRTRTRHFSGNRPGSRHGEAGFEELLKVTLHRLMRIAESTGRSLEELSLAWSISNPDIICTIGGVRSAHQLMQNVNAVNLGPTREILDELDKATSDLKIALGASPDVFESRENSRIY